MAGVEERPLVPTKESVLFRSTMRPIGAERTRTAEGLLRTLNCFLVRCVNALARPVGW